MGRFLLFAFLPFVLGSCASGGSKLPEVPLVDRAVFNVSVMVVAEGSGHLTWYGTGFGMAKTGTENLCIGTGRHLIRMSGAQNFVIKNGLETLSARVVAEFPVFDFAVLMVDRRVPAIVLPGSVITPKPGDPLVIRSRDLSGNFKKMSGTMGRAEEIPFNILGDFVTTYEYVDGAVHGQSGSPVFLKEKNNDVFVGHLVGGLGAYTYFVPLSIEVLAAWDPSVSVGCGFF